MFCAGLLGEKSYSRPVAGPVTFTLEFSVKRTAVLGAGPLTAVIAGLEIPRVVGVAIRIVVRFFPQHMMSFSFFELGNGFDNNGLFA